MPGSITAIARFTLLEARRTRLAWLLVAGMLVAAALALFAGALAITGAGGVRTALIAAALRLFAVLVVALFVATSMVREMNDKVADLMLALPMPRATWYFGKLCGYALVALAIALATGAMVACFAPSPAVLAWTVSLALELILVAALALLCLFTFNQVPAALCAVLAFYALARSIDALQLIAHGPVLAAHGLADRVAVALLDGIALLVPHLGRFARSEWLLYDANAWAELAANAGQWAIFVLVLAAAALFDLYRRNL